MRRDKKAGRALGPRRREASTSKRNTRKAPVTETAALEAELHMARDRQAASAEVLRAIATTSGDAGNALRRIAEITARLFGASSVTIHIAGNGNQWHQSIRWGTSSARLGSELSAAQLGPSGPNLPGTVFRTNQQIHVPDLDRLDPEFARWPTFPIARASGTRSLAGTPLRHEGKAIGVLNVHRDRLAPFSGDELTLLQVFADQAVIAIENARLFNETREALERQTATADILRVIASSPTEVGPALQAIVESACTLCDAYDANVLLKMDDNVHFSAHHGPIPTGQHNWPINRKWVTGRSVVDKVPVQVSDFLAPNAAEFPDGQEMARQQGHRCTLAVPLLREGEAIGAIVLRRLEPVAFNEKQISLLQTFANQAVIAIGNVRLFDELQAKTRDLEEALRYQTGSADILNVIASSPTDVKPVLKRIVESACELCGAYDALVRLKDGDGLAFGAHHGPLPVSLASVPISENSTAGMAVIGQKPVHVHDLLSTEGDRFPHSQGLARSHGERTILSVPLLRENESVGALVLRRTEVHPFSEKQIALLQTFADQAVIAIQNVKLFDEVQAKTRDLEQALRYQTGSANILKVIASSPTDVVPVLNAIAESACDLCEAYDAVLTLKVGKDLVRSAHHGPIPMGTERWTNDRRSVSGRAIAEQVPVHLHDVLSEEGAEFPTAQQMSRRDGCRTILAAPMLSEAESIGTIVLRRIEVRPFNDKQISLLQTFADQAVIAIGNVRLFEEVQERTRELIESLEKQTATSEVLEIISSSAGDLDPVFQKMLENATRICGANFGTMTLYEQGAFRTIALYKVPEAYKLAQLHQRIQPHPESGLSMIERTHRAVQIEDIRTEPPYREGHPNVRALADLGGARSLVIVPMLKEHELIGAITIFRQEVKPFTDKQTELVANFASQAVIAIENARLLNELRKRTQELSQSLEDLRTAQDRLIQTEKLASLGQLTAGIAHEIKNPLNFVNNFSALSSELIDELHDMMKSVALGEKTREEINEITQTLKGNLEKVVQHGRRADSIVKNMLLHSRAGSGERRPADINAIVEESLNLAYHGARAEKPGFNIVLMRDLDPNAGMIDLYPQEITRVLLNLISNGFHAAANRKAAGQEGFEPTLTASTRDLGTKVEIRIRDNGTGISPEVQHKMFNPFFTTKPAGEGTGLGLSMSHDIVVKQHGGRIDVATELGSFTEFIITLPRTMLA
jgi:GAF domain-containing protein